MKKEVNQFVRIVKSSKKAGLINFLAGAQTLSFWKVTGDLIEISHPFYC